MQYGKNSLNNGGKCFYFIPKKQFFFFQSLNGGAICYSNEYRLAHANGARSNIDS